MQRERLAWGFVLFFLAVWICTPVVDAGTFPATNRQEKREVKNKVLAAQFLYRATFGPSEKDILALAARMAEIGRYRAMREWINKECDETPTLHQPLAKKMILEDHGNPIASGFNRSRYRDFTWWNNAIAPENDDRLRQRVAWALSQIFVVNRNPAVFNSRRYDESGEPQYLGLCNYYDIFVRRAFDSYRDVLEEVTYHPIMGDFLTHRGNQPPDPVTGIDPDENYAREVEQLLSIGLYRMRRNGVLLRDGNGDLIPTYDNDDIKTFARVFTGLTYDDPNPNRSFSRKRVNYHAPMVMHDNFHDMDEKELLLGTTLPAGQTGADDISQALDNLFNHPNCAPFVCRLLIQQFVKPNPSRGYLRRVSRQFVRSSGNLKTVVQAILLDREALRSLRFQRVRDANRKLTGLMVKTRGTEFGGLREPVMQYTSMFRSFNAVSQYYTGRFMIPNQNNDMLQAPYESPSVFNFYLPDHQPQEFAPYTPTRRIPNGNFVGPVFQILTSVVANRYANQMRADVRDSTFNYSNSNGSGNNTANVTLDFSRVVALANDPDAMLTYLDLQLCYGTMSDAEKAIIAAAVSDETSASDLDKARGAILAVLTSSAAAVDN